MKIELRSLHVKGCGPLEDVTIDFTDAEGKPRPVTVIAGANGTGKTTVLELITALFEVNCLVHISGQMIGDSVLLEQEIAKKRFLKSKELLRKTKEATLLLNTSEGWNYQFVKTQNGLRWNPDFNPETKPLTSAPLEYREIKYFDGFASLENNDSSTIIPFPTLLYFPHPRKINAIQGTQLTKEDTTYHWIYRYENFIDFQGTIDSYLCWLAFIEPECPGIFSKTINFLNSLDFDGKTFGLKRTQLKVAVTTREGGNHFLEELSAGEQNILIMLLELRRRLLPGSIVLIDEIESSLHEAYQHFLARSLLKLQREIPFQLILSTHSKAIAKVFGWESTVILANW